VRYKLGQYAEADRYLERAIKASHPPGPRVVWVVFTEAGAYPILTDAWSIRGWVALFRGDVAAARARFSESLARDPELVSSLGGLGVALERSNDRAGAYEAYRRAAEVSPTYPLVVAGLRATGPRGMSAPGSR
jgi:tetratricopeptide (TPR) repeat protein